MDKTILAARLEQANGRVISAASALAQRFGISPTLVEALNKSPKTTDPDVKRMSALENVAAILEAMLGVEPVALPVQLEATETEPLVSSETPYKLRPTIKSPNKKAN